VAVKNKSRRAGTAATASLATFTLQARGHQPQEERPRI
jgi:hypothetical protein